MGARRGIRVKNRTVATCSCRLVAKDPAFSRRRARVRIPPGAPGLTYSEESSIGGVEGDSMEDKVYVVRSLLDRHRRRPFLAIFASRFEAEDYQEKVWEDCEVPDYGKGLVTIEPVELGKIQV